MRSRTEGMGEVGFEGEDGEVNEPARQEVRAVFFHLLEFETKIAKVKMKIEYTEYGAVRKVGRDEAEWRWRIKCFPSRARWPTQQAL